MKKLKDFLEVYKPKSPDEQKFVDKHVVIKHKDRNGNDDDVFKATNIKINKRKEERHGYDVGEDEKVYEEVEVSEDTFTDASLANLRVMKHKQEMKKIESSSKIHPLMKVRKLSDAKKHLTSLEADRDRLAAKHEKAMSRKKKVNEDIILDELLDEALDLLMLIDEKTLTPAEMKKREEVVKAIKRGNPEMDKSMAYAIATKTAKKVAEGTMPTADEPTDANKRMAQKVRDLLAKEKKPVKEEADELEELSVTTLKSYRTKARADAHDADDVDDERRYRKRAAGSNTSGKKIIRQGGSLGEEAELEESAKIAAHLIKRYGDNVRKSHVMSAAKDFGVDPSKLAKVVRTKLGKNMLDEEQMSPAEHYKADLPNILKDIRGKKKSHSDLRREYGLSWKRLANSTADEHGHNYNRSHLLAVGKQHMEEGAQIDELSKGKMLDYMDKASDARGHRNLPTKKVDNRYAGVKKASDKLANEEAELEEGMAMWKVDFPKQHAGKPVAAGSAHVKAQNVAHAHKVMAKRLGVDHTLLKAKVTKSSILPEEAEAIDELSKGTMGRYVNKAKDQIDAASWRTGFRQGSKPNADTTNDNVIKAKEKQLSKRHKGIETVVKKLTKEDIINRTIEKYVPEDVKFTPEERLMRRLEGLSESHIDIITGLFEQLNSDNKLKIIESVETHEGVNQILNFALENRGE